MAEAKLAELLNGNGNIISATANASVPVNQLLQALQKPYDPSMPQFYQQLGEIYGKRTLSSALAQGGAAQTASDTLGEAQSQLQSVEKRLAEVAMRLSGEQIVRPIVENVLNDLDWFFSPAELAKEAKRVSGQEGLDFDTLINTAQVEGGGARRPLAEDFIVEGTASAEIQKEVAIQFMLKMLEATQNDPDANREEMIKLCFDQMGFDADKFFKKQGGPKPVRKIIEMILAGDKPNVDPQMDAMGQLQELQMNKASFAQIRQQLQGQGVSTESWDEFIKVLDGYILDVGDLAKVQMQQMQQQAQAMQAAQAMAQKAKGGGLGNNPPQGPSGVMQGIQKGAGRMAAQPPAGSMGPRS
jgi:hypothetical protein